MMRLWWLAPIPLERSNEVDTTGDGVIITSTSHHRYSAHGSEHMEQGKEMSSSEFPLPSQVVGYRDDPHASAEVMVADPYEDSDYHTSGYFFSGYSRRRLWYIGGFILVAAVVIGVSVGVSNKKKSAAGKEGDGNIIVETNPSPTPAPRPPLSTQHIEEVIRSVALEGGTELDDNDSYQARSLSWLMGQNDYLGQVEDLTDAQLIQRYALGCIFHATNGVTTIYTDYTFGKGVIAGWRKQTQWLSPTSVCDGWFGVECWEAGTDKEALVKGLTLAENRLTGSFPKEAVLLKETLERLDLFDNLVWNYDDDGNNWLGEMTSLKYLYYGSTNFEYVGIPRAVRKLTNLQEYDCSYSLYHGPLDGSAFASLEKLEYLAMGGNAYNSTVPQEVYQLPRLKFLYLDNAFIDGTLDGIEQATELVELWIDHNPGLGGTVPTGIGKLSDSLGSLSITDCDFTGTIPTELGQLTQMKQMWISSNQFRGTIPTELGNLSHMERLELFKNPQLDGSMPNEVCKLRDPNGLITTLVTDCSSGSIECNCCTECY